MKMERKMKIRDETKNKEKKVCFDLDENDVEEDNNFMKIQVQVDNIAKTIIWKIRMKM